MRTLPAQTEVTGIGGNTTQANYCAQVTELKALGGCPGTWYMVSAVKAHEDIHLTRFKPGLDQAAPTIETSVETLSVPSASGKTKAQAITEIKALAGFAAAQSSAQQTWLAKILTLVAGDHNAGGPTDTAEHGVVDPVIAAICAHAKTNAWAACAACPS